MQINLYSMKNIQLAFILLFCNLCLAQNSYSISAGVGVSFIHKPLILVGNNEYSSPYQLSHTIQLSSINKIKANRSIEFGLSYSRIAIQDMYISSDQNSNIRLERISNYSLDISYLDLSILYQMNLRKFEFSPGIKFSKRISGKERFYKVLYYGEEVIPESDIISDTVDGINLYNASLVLNMTMNVCNNLAFGIEVNGGILNLLTGDSQVVPVSHSWTRRLNTIYFKGIYKI